MLLLKTVLWTKIFISPTDQSVVPSTWCLSLPVCTDSFYPVGVSSQSVKKKKPSTWKLNQTPSNWTTGRNDVTHTVTRVSFCSRCRVFWETRWSFCSALWVNYHLSKCPVLLTTLGVLCQQIKSTTELIRPTEETWRSGSFYESFIWVCSWGWTGLNECKNAASQILFLFQTTAS